METNDRDDLNRFIRDVNVNMGNLGEEINKLSNRNTEICLAMKDLRDSINMNRVRANVLNEIKSDISKIKPKKLSSKILFKIDKYLYEDYRF